MITLLIATAYTVHFSGGTPNQFTEVLSKDIKENVVLVQGEPRVVSKLDFTDLTLNQMSQAIRSQTNHFMQPGTEMVFSDQLLPSKLLTGTGFKNIPGFKSGNSFEHIQYDRTKKETKVPFTFVPLPSPANVDGKITFATEKENALQLTSLDGRLSKPLRCHWIYAEQPIFVQAKEMGEVAFLTDIAKGLGARFNPAAKNYSFDLDPNVIRSRAISSLARMNVGQDPESEDSQGFKFRIGCLNALTTNQISEVLATPSSLLRAVVNRSPKLTNLVTQRIKQLEKIQKTYGPNTRASKNAIGLMEKIDPDRPSYIVMDSKFYVMMEIAVKSSTGESGTVVLLP